jgi:2-polyprenyl-3-methyl-5-hydroxy-6-metoxy-1,4-benzoquinol methylase
VNCYLCGNAEHLPVNGQVRDNPDIKIKKCASCGLVFLDNSSHIDEKFYESNGMGKTVPLGCNFAEVDILDTQKRFNLYQQELKDKHVLDFGCGRGSFLAELREKNITPYLYALEPNQQHFGYLSSNFALYRSIEEIPAGSLDCITMFHVLEHLKDPLDILTKLYEKLNSGGKLIIEVPNSDDSLLSLYESDAFSKFTYWSCHLYLFNSKTLEILIRKTSYKIDYIRQYQRYSLSNHLYWLAKGKPGGHSIWSFFDDAELQAIYDRKLADLGKCDTVIAKISKA